MKINEKIIFIILAVIIFGSSVYMIRSILAPFIFSLIVAYFLHPLAGYLCKKKMSRLSASLLIIGVFFSVFITILAIILPIIYKQSESFILSVPQYFQIVVSEIYPKCATALNSIGIKVNNDLLQVIDEADLASKIFDFIKNFAINALSSSVAFVNILSLIFITPILIFYLLKDWDLLVQRIHAHLPAKVSKASNVVMGEINKALSGFVRGQITICLILGIIYSVLLSLAGLHFGFLVGIFTGFFSFIPFVGALTGFVVAIILAYFQWGFSFVDLFTVAMIFVFCQILESNFLTPKLIGKNIGLHPVWIIFGLFVFGSIFGFIGILFATPLTAICAVLFRFLSLEYKKHIS